MGSIAIHPITVSTLQHVSAFGPCTLDTLRTAVPGITSKTTNNLVQLGHCMRTAQGFAITPKGREKLRSLFPAEATRQAQPAQPAEQAPASASPMMSNAEIEAAILKVLQRARVRVSLPDISRRTVLAEHLVRPTLTTMVQAGAVLVSAGKPALYRLAITVTATRVASERDTRHTGDARNHLSSHDYTCPELQRNPGIAPERFAAYALPSRVGNRLHWPDGRVTPVADRTAGLPA